MNKVTKLGPKEICDWYMKKFADKSKTFGCKVEIERHGMKGCVYHIGEGGKVGHQNNDDLLYFVFENYLAEQDLEYSYFDEGYMVVTKQYEIDKYIGHPLNRGRLEQSIKQFLKNGGYDHIEAGFKKSKAIFGLLNMLWEIRSAGISLEILDKTIYEWVEEIHMLSDLIVFKDYYEQTAINREDQSTLT